MQLAWLTCPFVRLPRAGVTCGFVAACLGVVLLPFVTPLPCARRSLTALHEWFAQRNGLPNQKCFCAICKLMTTLSPKFSPVFHQLALSWLQWAVLQGAWTQYSEEMTYMKGYITEVLVRSVTEWKKHMKTKSEWWSVHKQLCEHIVDLQACDRCFGVTDEDWTAVQAELEELVSSGELGRCLFGTAWEAVGQSKIDACVAKLLKDFKGKPISKASVAALLASLHQEMSQLGRDSGEVLTAGSVRVVVYLGWKLEISVSSTREWLELQASAIAKSKAIWSGALEPLFAERCLGDEAADDVAGVQVDQAYIKDLAGVRLRAAGYAEAHSLLSTFPTAAQVKDIMEQHKTFLLGTDGRFKVEASFIARALNGKADEVFKQQVLMCLPSDTQSMTMAASAAALTKLCEGPLFVWTNQSLQVVAEVIHESCKSLLEGRSVPKLQRTEHPLLLQARASMSLWLVAPTDPPVSPTPAPGAASALAWFARFEEQATSGEAHKFVELSRLLQFGWLLSEGQRKTLQKWADALAAGSSPAGSSGGGPAKAGPKSRGPTAKSQVAALFAK